MARAKLVLKFISPPPNANNEQVLEFAIIDSTTIGDLQQLLAFEMLFNRMCVGRLHASVENIKEAKDA